MKSGPFLFLRGLRASHFRFCWNPATVARMFGGFASSPEAKSASRSEAPSTSHSERATFAFNWNPATVARICWPFHSLGRRKSASLSGVPMSKDSE